jgi:hypothetical protein
VGWRCRAWSTATHSGATELLCARPAPELFTWCASVRVNRRWAPDLAYWDVEQRRLVLIQDVLGVLDTPNQVVVAEGGPKSSPGSWPRMVRCVTNDDLPSVREPSPRSLSVGS